MAGLAWPLFAVALATAPQPARPQAAPAGWDCAGGTCTEAAATVMRHAGTFVAGAGLSPEKDADRIAALELQSQREFEYAVSEAAVISARLRPRPGGPPAAPEAAARVVMWSSPDGETYTLLEDGAAVKAGDLVLVAVRQARDVADGVVSYLPASWELEVSFRRQLAEAAVAAAAPPLPPLPVSADTDPEPEDAERDMPEVPPVAGTAQPDPAASGDAPDAPAEPALGSSDELAVELQRELARLGCYTSEIDGLWGPGSRGAMDAFNRASGAALPVDRPSPAALAATARASGRPCG